MDVYKAFWYLDMLCMGIWVLPYSDTPVQVGVGGGVLGVDLKAGCDVVMSKLRAQQASDWILHPYGMYTKHFGTLICCV